MVLKKGLLAAPPWSWVSDGHFALPSSAQARHCRTISFSLVNGGACGGVPVAGYFLS